MFDLTPIREMVSEMKLLRQELTKINTFIKDFGGALKDFAEHVKTEDKESKENQTN